MYKLFKTQFSITNNYSPKVINLNQWFNSWDEKTYDDETFRLSQFISDTEKIYRYFTRDTLIIIYVKLRLDSERLVVEIYSTILGYLLPFLFMMGSICAFIFYENKLAWMLLITSIIYGLVLYLFFKYCVNKVKKEIQRLIPQTPMYVQRTQDE